MFSTSYKLVFRMNHQTTTRSTRVRTMAGNEKHLWDKIMTIYKAIHCKVAMSRKQYTYNHRANPDCNKPFMMNVETRESCRELFKEINILTLASLYMLEVTCFIREYCQSLELNTNVHNHNTQRKMDIHHSYRKLYLVAYNISAFILLLSIKHIINIWFLFKYFVEY